MTARPPNSLVKFLSAKEAIQILQEGKIRWHSPQLSTDPFDLNADSQLAFDSNQLLTTTLKSVSSMIFSRDNPKGLPNHPLIKAVRRWRAENRFGSEEEVEDAMGELLGTIIEQQKEKIKTVILDWQDFIRSTRMLSLVEKHTDIFLWERLAAEHTGVAIRFLCEEDGMIMSSHLEKVKYTDHRSQITTLAEQVGTIIGQTAVDPQENFLERLSTRPRTESREREWRCFKQLDHHQTHPDSPEESWQTDIAFAPNEVSRLYFGLKTSERDKQELINALKPYKSTKVLTAKIHSNLYSLEFDNVSLR